MAAVELIQFISWPDSTEAPKAALVSFS